MRRPAARWSCLTGTVQIALCWLMLEKLTGEDRWRRPALQAIRFVRGTVRLDGPPDIRGGVQGSFPVGGAYCPWEYPSWAAKFLADACLAELRLEPAAG